MSSARSHCALTFLRVCCNLERVESFWNWNALEDNFNVWLSIDLWKDHFWFLTGSEQCLKSPYFDLMTTRLNRNQGLINSLRSFQRLEFQWRLTVLWYPNFISIITNNYWYWFQKEKWMKFHKKSIARDYLDLLLFKGMLTNLKSHWSNSHTARDLSPCLRRSRRPSKPLTIHICPPFCRPIAAYGTAIKNREKFSIKLKIEMWTGTVNAKFLRATELSYIIATIKIASQRNMKFLITNPEGG